jgi:hypothetical protein
MNTLSTDKRFVIALQGGTSIYVNEHDFNAAKNAVLANIPFLEIGDRLISTRSILYIVPASEVETPSFQSIKPKL